MEQFKSDMPTKMTWKNKTKNMVKHLFYIFKKYIKRSHCKVMKTRQKNI